MITVPLEMDYLEKFDFFDVLLPSFQRDSEKLVLIFPNVKSFFDYIDIMIDSLNNMSSDESLGLNMGMQNKIKFMENIIVEMARTLETFSAN